ncbi:MAG: hypothetical protein RSB39_00790 [Oscillospiraceae bacterium]
MKNAECFTEPILCVDRKLYMCGGYINTAELLKKQLLVKDKKA